ncbi:MAG TPA: AI-2E family transporter [Candidatus Limnocylindrales bacterium]|jgi:predicted PurR-regulated permease PerM
MNDRLLARGSIAFILVLATALLLRELASLLVPLLFGGFLALAAWPLVPALERRNVPHGLALALAIIAIFVVVLASAAIIALSVGELIALLPRYETRLTATIDGLRAALAQFGISTDEEASFSVLAPEQIATLVRSVVSGVSSAGLSILVVTLTTAYGLVGAHSFRSQFERALGRDHIFIGSIRRFSDDLRRYLLVRAALGLFAAILVFALLLVLGVPLPALWAFLVFAASFVPNLGVILALVPPTLLALLDGGMAAAAVVVAGYTVVNLIQDNVLQPIVLGVEFNLSPLVVFVCVVVWAWIFGAAGAFLAVPLTLALIAILETSQAAHGLTALARNREAHDRSS